MYRLVATVVVLLICPLSAQETKSDGAQILVITPLAIAPGAETRLTIRGLKLDEATEVRFAGEAKPEKLTTVSKGKAAVPNQQDAKNVGDTQVEIELKLPQTAAAGDAALAVVTPHGETVPQHLTIVPADQLIPEQEPNGELRDAQMIRLGQTVPGAVERPKDVDVYQFSAAAGQRIEVSTTAAQRGSALDPMLMLFDERGRIIAIQDDAETARDALLRATLSVAGSYFIVLLDAHDQGGPAHPYLLSVRTAE